MTFAPFYEALKICYSSGGVYAYADFSPQNIKLAPTPLYTQEHAYEIYESRNMWIINTWNTWNYKHEA